MDGWFPCLMPCIGEPNKIGDYILTHGACTILGSYESPVEAGFCLSNLAPDFMDSRIRLKIEEQMECFWPGFTRRFHCKARKGNGVVYIFSGKISNVVDAVEEVVSLLDRTDAKVIWSNGYGYARDSELNRSREKIEMRPIAKDRNTCFLQTHRELCVKA
ncbi:hypothetical protein BDW67DRAFT_188935 [Aspergillus spinulosporus]